MYEKPISSAVIARLPRYYRYLGELLENDVVRISSKELSEKMQVTASQIRQDLNHFGGFGQQGYGYNVEYLYTEIGKILGLDRKYHMIIVGAGNLGQAIANYADFERRGFYIKGIFDVNPELAGKMIRGVEVRPARELESFIRENPVHIAALTIPKENAPRVAADLARWGVRAIWNFVPADLSLPKEVLVENVHLTESLMRLSYNLRARDEAEERRKAEQSNGI